MLRERMQRCFSTVNVFVIVKKKKKKEKVARYSEQGVPSLSPPRMEEREAARGDGEEGQRARDGIREV